MQNPVCFIDPDGMQADDWYKNLFTGSVSWKDGHSSRLGYENLGHTWGSTDVNGNRFLMDGETKQISYNGKVLQDFNKNKSAFDITNGFTLWGGSPGGGGDTSGLKGITKDSFTASDVPGIGGTAPGPGQVSALGKLATIIKNFLNGVSATGVTAGVTGRIETINTTVNSTEDAKDKKTAVDSVTTTYYGTDGKPYKQERRAKRDDEQ